RHRDLLQAGLARSAQAWTATGRTCALLIGLTCFPPSFLKESCFHDARTHRGPCHCVPQRNALAARDIPSFSSCGGRSPQDATPASFTTLGNLSQVGSEETFITFGQKAPEPASDRLPEGGHDGISRDRRSRRCRFRPPRSSTAAAALA